MRRVICLLAVLSVLVAASPVGAWRHYPPVRPVHYYTLANAHREDAHIEGWQAAYSMTHTTCESATVTALVMAHLDGWTVAPIAPVVLDMERSFPPSSPCSVTLLLR